MNESKSSVQERLLAAAAELFLEKDYQSTSLREIARRADTTSAMIAYYFKSKHGLFEEMVKNEYQKFFGRMMQEFQQQPPVQQNVNIIKKLQTIHKEMPFMAPFLVKIMTTKGGPGSAFIKSQFAMEQKAFEVGNEFLKKQNMINPETNVEVLRITMMCVTLLPALFNEHFQELYGDHYEAFQNSFAEIVGGMINQYTLPE